MPVACSFCHSLTVVGSCVYTHMHTPAHTHPSSLSLMMPHPMKYLWDNCLGPSGQPRTESISRVPYQDTSNEQHRIGFFGDLRYAATQVPGTEQKSLFTPLYLSAFVLQGATYERRSGTVLSVATCLTDIHRHGSVSVALSLARVFFDPGSPQVL